MIAPSLLLYKTNFYLFIFAFKNKLDKCKIKIAVSILPGRLTVCDAIILEVVVRICTLFYFPD